MAGEGVGTSGRRLRPLNEPRRIAVFAGADGVPMHVAGKAVDTVRDEGRIEDAWWTGDPVRRRYFECVLADGTLLVVFCDRRTGDWFTQRG